MEKIGRLDLGFYFCLLFGWVFLKWGSLLCCCIEKTFSKLVRTSCCELVQASVCRFIFLCCSCSFTSLIKLCAQQDSGAFVLPVHPVHGLLHDTSCTAPPGTTAWYPLVSAHVSGLTRGRWTCQSEGEGWSSCICLSSLDIVTWFIVPQYSIYILNRLILKEDKALHSCCHKYTSLLIFSFSLSFFSSSIFFGFFNFFKPLLSHSFLISPHLFNILTYFPSLILVVSTHPLVLDAARLRHRQHSGCPGFPPGSTLP